MLHLRGLDTPVAVEFAGPGGPDLLTAAHDAWSRCLADPSPDAVRRLVVVGDHPAAEPHGHPPIPTPDLTGADPAALLDRLSPLVTLAAIEAQAGVLLMLHAAAVADPVTGRALALVGPSGAGKTTATSVLARRWGYVTDETVGVREDATIAVYPKPLSVKVGDAPFKEQRSLDALGLAATPSGAHLHRVLLLDRDGSPEPWVEEVGTVEAVALLAPETSYLSRLERPLHRLARALGPRGLLRLHYREAEQLPDLVERLLEED